MLRLIMGAPRRRKAHNQNAHDDHETNQNKTESSTTNCEDPPHSTVNDEWEDGMEPWTEYIRRATRIATEHAECSKMECWTTLYFKRKRRWASRVATHGCDRWTFLSSMWEPSNHDHRPAQRHHG
eukprot:2466097-Pyramimonas_sp.AAC.1